ncbi:hypothetical protein LXL04_036957 [Taraxacum kok-saghyz]
MRSRAGGQSDSKSESGSSECSSEDETENEEERRRRKRKRKRREEKEKRRRREKEKKKRRKEKDEDKKKKKKKKKDKKKDKVSKDALTNSWGKYGIIREVDMWQVLSLLSLILSHLPFGLISTITNYVHKLLLPSISMIIYLFVFRNKRPEFTAWLLEVKQVNLESLPNWEEKQMFKLYVFALILGVIHGYLNFPFYFLFNFVNSIKCIRLSDLNTPTGSWKTITPPLFLIKSKYYSLDAYHRKRIENAMKKGSMKATKTERVVFDDEEQRRLELQREREKQKETEVEALKRSMQSRMVCITFLSVNIWYLVFICSKDMRITSERVMNVVMNRL